LDFADELVNGARGVVVGFAKPEKTPDKSFAASKKFPLVRFTSGVTRVITPEQWVVEVGGTSKATRKQVPLNLAWALSIHKSQGMTISKVAVALANVFEYGQAYVALSRATSLSGLWLIDFHPRVIKANPRILQYYRDIASQQQWEQNRLRTEEPEQSEQMTEESGSSPKQPTPLFEREDHSETNIREATNETLETECVLDAFFFAEQDATKT